MNTTVEARRAVAQMSDEEVAHAAEGVVPGDPIWERANRGATRTLSDEQLTQAAAREFEERWVEAKQVEREQMMKIGIAVVALVVVLALASSGGG